MAIHAKLKLVFGHKFEYFMADRLDQDIYLQLKTIANKLMAHERQGHTLSPTDLVHEAYLKVKAPEHTTRDSRHFLFLLARQMRRLLVDYGRYKAAKKRGGDQQRVLYTDALGIGQNSMTDFSVISAAIDQLEAMDERAAKAIDLYYFTNVSREKAAKILGISVPTLERDLRFAKAHISHHISEQG